MAGVWWLTGNREYSHRKSKWMFLCSPWIVPHSNRIILAILDEIDWFGQQCSLQRHASSSSSSWLNTKRLLIESPYTGSRCHCNAQASISFHFRLVFCAAAALKEFKLISSCRLNLAKWLWRTILAHPLSNAQNPTKSRFAMIPLSPGRAEPRFGLWIVFVFAKMIKARSLAWRFITVNGILFNYRRTDWKTKRVRGISIRATCSSAWLSGFTLLWLLSICEPFFALFVGSMDARPSSSSLTRWLAQLP